MAAQTAQHQKGKKSQKEIWQHEELGQPKEGAQPEFPSQGWMTMSLGVLRARGQRVQQGRASTNGISATLTHLLFLWCHGRSAPTCPQRHRNGEAAVSFHSQSSSCISCTWIATVFHINWCTEPKAFRVFSCCSRSVLNQVAPETSATFFKDFYKVQKPLVLRMWHWARNSHTQLCLPPSHLDLFIYGQPL